MLLRQFQASFDNIHLVLRRTDALVRLLLETVQDIHRILETNRIDRTVGIAVIVFHHFQYTRRAEALERLGLIRFQTLLSKVQGVSDNVNHAIRHRQQILFR